MAEPAFRCEGLCYRYPEARADALRRVSLTVEPGEFVVLCGRSGSGKSTLLRAACGLVPHFHGGAIERRARGGGDGRPHARSRRARRRRRAGRPGARDRRWSASRCAPSSSCPSSCAAMEPEARSRAVEEVALALGIDDLLERTTDTLSGGELQRVALAAALATRPRLVLLDEPTSQLDPVAGDELVSLLRRLNEEWGVAWSSASIGSSAAWRPPTGWSRSMTARSPSTAPPAPSSSGPRTPSRRWPPPPPASFARPDCRSRSASGRRVGRSPSGGM